MSSRQATLLSRVSGRRRSAGGIFPADQVQMIIISVVRGSQGEREGAIDHVVDQSHASISARPFAARGKFLYKYQGKEGETRKRREMLRLPDESISNA